MSPSRRALLPGFLLAPAIALVGHPAGSSPRTSPAAPAATGGTGGTIDAVPFGLQLVAPGITSVSSWNQRSGPGPGTVAIDDRAMRVQAAPTRIAGIAKGLKNVAVVVGGKWHPAVPDSQGNFAATVDFSASRGGPVVVDVFGWDTPPDNHNFKVAIDLRVILFVERAPGGAAEAPPPRGHPAYGRRLAWSDDFASLPETAWYRGPKPDGQEYGLGVFTKTNERGTYGVHDGFVRIRSLHVPDLQDERGWGRRWVTGHLSTGFPDGSATAAFRKGYFEARMMLPAGPGCWSSFWLLDQDSILKGDKDGAVEIDVFEAYGHSKTSYVATQHDWPPNGSGRQETMSQRNITGLPDLTVDFHDFGVEVTDDTVIFSCDGREHFRTPLARKDTVSPFFMMLTLAMSHDWPIAVPPAGYYDLWIDRVRYYA